MSYCFIATNQAQTSIEYNAMGQVTKITRTDGALLTYAYNDARQLTTVTGAMGVQQDSALKQGKRSDVTMRATRRQQKERISNNKKRASPLFRPTF